MANGSKTCRKCGDEKPVEAFHLDKRRTDGRFPWCADCRRAYYGQTKFAPRKFATKAEYDKDYRARLSASEATERQHRSYLWTQYRTTPQEYQARLDAQGGRCAICGGDSGPSTSRYGTDKNRYSFDHDHRCCPGTKSCGLCIRGLLCGHCNRALGGFRDDPAILASAIEYLRHWSDHAAAEHHHTGQTQSGHRQGEARVPHLW